MNRPSSIDLMLGRRGSGPALAVLAILAIYAAATDQAPWPLAGLVLFFAYAARGARARVAAYSEFRGEWNAMAGAGDTAPAARPRKGQLTPGRFAFIALWATSGIWLSRNPDLSGAPIYAAFAGTFLLTSAGGLLGLLFPSLRRLGGARPARTARVPRTRREAAFIVSLCLSPSRTSPNVRRIVPALPAYARALLTRQADPKPN